MTAGQADRDDVLELMAAHSNRSLATLGRLLDLPLEIDAEGTRVHGSDGVRYLDCSGYGVFLLGHRHPRIVSAVSDQLLRQPLSSKLLPNPVLARASAALARVAPGPLSKVVFTNSGAEAVELALKLGRSAGRRSVIAMEGGFHGKTLGALSATGSERLRAPFAPLLPDVHHVPFGSAEGLEAALAAEGPATVIIEPVLGEGGVVVPPAGYLAAARGLCDAAGALLVADEVQTGLGRTGRWWAVEHDGVVPDVLLCGKALGGGVVPVAAVVAREEVYGPLDRAPFLHSSTFGGNPLAAAAVVATLRVIEDEGIVERARTIGDAILAGLAPMAEDVDALVDVRGAGLLIGLELADAPTAARTVEALLDAGILPCSALNDDRVIRLTPSALLDDAETGELIDRVGRALRTLPARPNVELQPVGGSWAP